MGRPKYPREFDRRFWGHVRGGLSVIAAADAAGVSGAWGRRLFRKAGGVNPTRVVGPAGRYLSWSEREEIAALDHAGEGVREIARRLGRDPATISRELVRGATHRGYRASVGQGKADQARAVPRTAKLATNLRLRKEVQDRLKGRESPEQIAGRLKIDFPDDLEMRVSAETIYQSLYVQARGGLKRELTAYLRTGRSMRKPRRVEGERRGRIPNMVMISERPPEIEERAVAGHWEGDLIMGTIASNSAVGTLVERTTGFVMLLHLPDGHGALAVQEALVAKIAALPEQLKLSLTWDQGTEMTNHVQIAEATGLDIYFCDPHSPWQRGTNENTNRLLRFWFEKGTDLSVHTPEDLRRVAAKLNRRPRPTLNLETPANRLNQLLHAA
jgi:IS30 family transposase